MNHNQTSIAENRRLTSTAAEIICEELTKQYQNESIPSVDHINLKVDPGNLIVLLGPSGCGKTTLLKMINRLYEPTSGQIKIDGIEVHDLAPTTLRRRIGYVIQQVGLFPHMSIEQNIAVVPNLEGWETRKTAERVGILLDMVGLPQEYKKKFPRQLSGGEQQRVGLARALAVDPGILLMDEPFAAVDAINRTCLQDELLEIHHKVKKTVLFVTHDVEEALKLADKILIMRAGQKVQYGTPLEIINHPQNEFVQELIGSSNLLRRLSLLSVRQVLNAHKNGNSAHPEPETEPGESAIIHPEDDLRSALTRMLESGAKDLQVIDGENRQVGIVRFSDLRAVLIEQIADPKR